MSQLYLILKNYFLKKKISSEKTVLRTATDSKKITKNLAFLVAQTVKRLPTIRETRVRSLGGEDPLEKEKATHSSTLAWKIPWMEEVGGLQSMASQSQTRLSDFTH